MRIAENILKKKGGQKKQLALLIDPDKFSPDNLSIINQAEEALVDYLFLGGSFITTGDMEKCLLAIKSITKLPVILFPGDHSQVNKHADGILFLSLLSGRNPEYLIGQQVVSALKIKESGLEVIPTGYLLIESGVVTTALYISGTLPIPQNKPEIAVSTALAGELLGMKLIYLDGGSGAKIPVSIEIIKAVKNTISVPLVVGGGIKDLESAETAWNAGADVVVIGTAFEKNPSLLQQFKNR